MSLNHEKSDAYIREAEKYMPAGVNSPVRAFRSVPGNPIVFRSGKGSRVTDVDGNEYIDFCNSWGPLILGHAHPDVVQAVKTAVESGMSFGAPCEDELTLAKMILEKLPFADMLRFVSSGTEAVMSAIRVARGFTKRDLILKFQGCYHGHADHLLVDAGSGLATFGTPSSAGVPAEFAGHTATLPLDDDEALEEFFRVNGSKLAAVIVEPIPANAGLLIQRREYLEKLRELTKKSGSLLIFDEVINGFRVAAGGAAELYGIEPDIATYGKIVGGGMPVGCYAARKEIMEIVAPLGPVYQAGTLSGNPVAMAAGIATLKIVFEDGFFGELEAKTAMLVAALQAALGAAEIKGRFQRVGSIFWLALGADGPISRFDQVDTSTMELYGRIQRGLIERGVYWAPSGWEVGFVSSAHTPEDIQATVAAFVQATAEAKG